MGCPHCGTSESGVVRSYGSIVKDEIHRRRECGSCVDSNGKRGRFPTAERVDWPTFWREHPELRIEGDATWQDLVEAFQRAWDQCIAHHYVRRDWINFERILVALQHREPGSPRHR